LERVDWHISRRREVAGWYRCAFETVEGLQFSPQCGWAKAVFWMSSVVLDDKYDRDAVMQKLMDYGVETRPFFPPMHTLPIYQDLSNDRHYPVAERLGKQGINLPSSALLSRDQVEYVVSSLVEALKVSG
jgi:perosamine synthetase